MTTLIALLVTFIGISVLVAAHEAGHWAMGEVFGFRVPIFQIGMGSPSISLGRCRDTDFRVSPWLIGGFCLIPEIFDRQTAKEIMTHFGEPDFTPRDFAVWKRALVALAGPAMSFLSPLVFMFLLFAISGVPEATHSSAQVQPAAAHFRAAGMSPTDVGSTVDGDFSKIHHKAVLMLPLMPVPKPPVTATMRSHVQPEEILAAGTTSGITFRRVGLAQAAVASWRFNVYMTKLICVGMADLFRNLNPFAGSSVTTLRSHDGSSSPGANDMHGIVGIFQMAANAWQSGWYMFIVFLSILSLNWAVFNLLPIPMLDGGFMLFLGWEALTGKRLNRETEFAIRNVFMWLLLGLMFFGLYNDFAHPIR